MEFWGVYVWCAPGRRAAQLSDRPRGDSCREHATTEERAFKRALAVHAAATEAGRLAHCIEVFDGLTVWPQDLRVEVRLDPAQALACHHRHPDRDQWHRAVVDDPLKVARAQPVSAPVAQLRNPPELVVVEQRLAAGDRLVIAIHLAHH